MDRQPVLTAPADTRGPADARAPGTDRAPRTPRLTDEREREILRAAYDLLAEVGYDGLRFDAVAARARASKATLYRHWTSKAHLVAQAVRCCKQSTMDVPNTGSLRGDLVALLTRMATTMAGEDGRLLAGLVMAMQLDQDLATEMRVVYTEKGATSRAVCDRARERGELTCRPDLNLVEEIAPALLFMHSFARGQPLDAAFIDHLVDDILLPLLTR